MVGLILYTFVTMVGGNPDHWAYGFTYWDTPVSEVSRFRCPLIIRLEGRICRVPRSWEYRPLPRTHFLHYSGLLHVSTRYESRLPRNIADCTIQHGRTRVHLYDGRRSREPS